MSNCRGVIGGVIVIGGGIHIYKRNQNIKARYDVEMSPRPLPEPQPQTETQAE
ncbi:hypothetical protein [Parashewanella curva]|uniref:hypothetical protein n=1 Tax=Parashewanella curva TaxID=2338552 RepID=UPI0014049E17|nr:hypothetical protein [Parashewanella curva]